MSRIKSQENRYDVSDKERKRIYELRSAEGLTFTVIAERMGRHTSTVSNIFREEEKKLQKKRDRDENKLRDSEQKTV
jgi:IS30 family transposase